MDQLTEQQKRKVFRACRKHNPIWFDHVAQFVEGNIVELPNEGSEYVEPEDVCGHVLDICKVDACIVGEVQKFNVHYEHKSMINRNYNKYQAWVECEDCVDFGTKLFEYSTAFENKLNRELFLVALYEFYVHRGFIRESKK